MPSLSHENQEYLEEHLPRQAARAQLLPLFRAERDYNPSVHQDTENKDSQAGTSVKVRRSSQSPLTLPGKSLICKECEVSSQF